VGSKIINYQIFRIFKFFIRTLGVRTSILFTSAWLRDVQTGDLMPYMVIN
jgi:hypothetical protein